MARLMPPVSPCGPWPCSGTSTPTELALAAMTRLVARRSTTLTASSTIPTGSTTCSSPPPWEVINYEPRNPIESETFYVVYGHMASINRGLKLNTPVSAGQEVGKVGHSGTCKGNAHLHIN